ncbi:transmembrane protein 170a [Lynx pardinus]|uniref:Transmembrane protein 170A n=1 Tax=Lynx pardinus TaxID=191816 RepID=A0A485PAG6_LYNPA|nr:transmembrane protein 170a [Lynx pardinus]
MEHEGSGGSGGYLTAEPTWHLDGFENEISGYDDEPLVIPVLGKSVTCDLSLLFLVEMWYGVFLWALVSSLFFHVPAGLLALFTLRHHKYGRFMSVSILLMGIVGPITAGILTSAAIAGVYRAAGKEMIPFEALTLGTGQTFCVVVVSFLRVLATL